MYIDIATLSANYMQRYAFFCEFTSFLGYIYSFFISVLGIKGGYYNIFRL